MFDRLGMLDRLGMFERLRIAFQFSTDCIFYSEVSFDSIDTHIVQLWFLHIIFTFKCILYTIQCPF